MKEPEPKSHALDAVLNGVRGISRRGFLALGTLAAVGCATSNQRARKLPDPVWEGVAPKPAVCPPVIPNKRGDMAFVLDRAAWTRGLPDRSNLNPMLPVRYITLHHDGMSPFLAKDQASAAARIELIRVSHRGHDWADIGYHFVVDRGGRVWEGRDLKWQGAHVKDHNEGNIGICCLGNFDEQSPSDEQLEAAERIVACLMDKYRVPVSRVRSHQEWQGARTACPGRSLQREFVQMRRNELSRLGVVDEGSALA
jgi:hypothetical protein